MWGGYLNAEKIYNKLQDTKTIPTKSSYMDRLIGEGKNMERQSNSMNREVSLN
jgi:hypothetical protein